MRRVSVRPENPANSTELLHPLAAYPAGVSVQMGSVSHAADDCSSSRMMHSAVLAMHAAGEFASVT